MKKVLLVIAGLCVVALLVGTVAQAAEDATRKILKEGLLGAATGAIASEASGGKAGKGALIGAGVNIVGGALLDTMMQESTPPAKELEGYGSQEIYQKGFQDGFQKGHMEGYKQGYKDGIEGRKQ